MNEREQQAFDQIFGAIEKGMDALHEAAYRNLDEAFTTLDRVLAEVKDKTRERVETQTPQQNLADTLGGLFGGRSPFADLVDKVRETAKQEAPAEPVRTEPSVAVKREDLVNYYSDSYGSAERARSVYANVSEAAVNMAWSGLPDESKSWVKRDPNSPL